MSRVSNTHAPRSADAMPRKLVPPWRTSREPTTRSKLTDTRSDVPYPYTPLRNADNVENV